MNERSKKRGLVVALQMILCEEEQSAVIRELCVADEDVGGRWGRTHSSPNGPINLSDRASDGSEEGGTESGLRSSRNAPLSSVPMVAVS